MAGINNYSSSWHTSHNHSYRQCLALSSKTFFILIDEYVDVCGICQVLLYNGLPLWGLLPILVHSVLNICAHRFIVDFVITFCTPYLRTFSCEFHYQKHFLALKTEYQFIAYPWAQLSVSLPFLFFSSSYNF